MSKVNYEVRMYARKPGREAVRSGQHAESYQPIASRALGRDEQACKRIILMSNGGPVSRPQSEAGMPFRRRRACAKT
jgi:hypothetical protein